MSFDQETTPARWRRSARCASNACVEVARLDDGAISVRDTDDVTARLAFGRGEWREFVRHAKSGSFDGR